MSEERYLELILENQEKLSNKIDAELEKSNIRIVLLEQFMIQTQTKEIHQENVAKSLKWFFGTALAVISIYVTYILTK
jgi:chaperone required for assembly of F1-ATPase